MEEAKAPLDQHTARRAALTLAADQLSLSSLKLTTEYLRHEAHTLLECIVENIPGGKLRASFMGLPMWASYALLMNRTHQQDKADPVLVGNVIFGAGSA